MSYPTCSKEFLRCALNGQKKLKKSSAVQNYSLPNYEEFTTLRLLEIAKKDIECWRHIPDQGMSSRQIDRKFLVNIMATHMRTYLDILVRNANEVRAFELLTTVTLASYGITKEMLREIDSHPYRSKKK